MNIDTSTISSSSEAAAYVATTQNRKIHGGNTFSSHLSSLQLDSHSSGEAVNEDVSSSASNDLKSDEKSYHQDKTSETTDAKTENKNPVQDVEIQNEQSQQNPQNQQGEQAQNQQSAELSVEILSVMKANGAVVNVDGVNNFKLVSGIREDIYASAAKINYSAISMSDDDAMFFANLLSKTDMSMQTIAGEFQKSLQAGNVQQVQKTAKVSSVLLEALSESMKTNKAFRIDFDNDVSVVLRVDRDGNLNANFIPGDKAVEAYLRNNIPYLKQRFEEQNLSYGELTYSKHKRQDQEDENQNNKENGHE